MVFKVMAQLREQWLFNLESWPSKGWTITQLRISWELAAWITSLVRLQFTPKKIERARGNQRIGVFHFQWLCCTKGSLYQICQVLKPNWISMEEHCCRVYRETLLFFHEFLTPKAFSKWSWLRDSLYSWEIL